MAPSNPVGTPATTPRPGIPRGRRWAHPIASWRTSRRATTLAEHRAELGRAGRQAQAELVRAGYHLGPVPYGYRALPVPAIDESGRAHLRRRLHHDPTTAPTVRLIFHLRARQHRSYAAITHQLITVALPPPGQGHDGPRLWTADAVRRIVTNPVYMGWQVWGRTRRGRRTDPAQWVVCTDAHEPIVTELLFTHAQHLPGTRPAALPPVAGHQDLGTPPQPVAELS